MYELDESENLGTSDIDGSALVREMNKYPLVHLDDITTPLQLDNGYIVNIFTTASSNTDEIFVSRMFAPSMAPLPGEDPVCGSAHGVIAPYWYTKRGITSGNEVKAKQVSKRGGDLRVVWERDAGRVRLRGQSVILATGNLAL